MNYEIQYSDEAKKGLKKYKKTKNHDFLFWGQ